MCNYIPANVSALTLVIRPYSNHDLHPKGRCGHTEGHDKNMAFYFGRDTAIQDVDLSHEHGIGQRMPQIRTMTDVARIPRKRGYRELDLTVRITCSKSVHGFQNNGYNGSNSHKAIDSDERWGERLARPIGITIPVVLVKVSSRTSLLVGCMCEGRAGHIAS